MNTLPILRRLLKAACFLTVAGSISHAQPAVSFDGDYNDTNTSGSATPALVYETGDFDNDTLADDRRGFNSIDTQFPIQADTNGVGTNNVFNAGYQVTHIDNLTDPLRGIYRYRGSGVNPDQLQVGSGDTTGGIPQTMAFAPNVAKANFINGFDDPTQVLSFKDNASSLTFSIDEANGTGLVTHFIVKDGTNWYISATSATNDQLDFAINAYTETWHPYDPDTNLLIPALTGGVLGSTFTNIQAVGTLNQVVAPAGSVINDGAQWLFYGLTALMEQTPTGALDPFSYAEFDIPSVAAGFTPTIDGVISDGEYADAIPQPVVYPDVLSLPNIGSISFAAGTDGSDATEADTSLTAYYKWDANYLYVAFDVKDDVFVPTIDGFRPYPNDHVLFGFSNDPVNNTGAGDLLVLELSQDTSGNTVVYLLTEYPGTDPTLTFLNSDFVTSTNAGGYVIEARISWTDIGLVGAPIQGQAFETALILLDNDANDGQRDILMRSVGDFNFLNDWHDVFLGGLDNTWDNYLFRSNLGLLPSGRLDDADGGGASNEFEWLFGGDPTDPSDDASLQPILESVAGGTMTYKYNRRYDAGPLGLTYDIRVTDDLSATDLAGDVEGASTAVSQKFEQVTVNVTLPVSGKRFITTIATD